MPENVKKADLLGQYDKKEKLYKDFLEYFNNTITGILNNESIALQSIDSRLKEKTSLDKKIKLKNKYTKIEDITDICGIRIITYFSDDVDKIAEIIRKEFRLDEVNSIDKRESDDPTKFGYVSLHYIVSLKENRTELPEAKKFKNLKIEIQIRTILQHAWAEIEHDLGYKAVENIPIQMRRNFSRLAGIIELADEEFVRIKNSMAEYFTDSKSKIDNEEENLFVDNITISAFVENDQDYRKLVDSLTSIVSLMDNGMLEEDDYKHYIPKIVGMCFDLEIKTISEFKKVIFTYSGLLKDIMLEQGTSSISILTPILHITHTLIGKNSKNISNEEFIEESRRQYNEMHQQFADQYPFEDYGTNEWDEDY